MTSNQWLILVGALIISLVIVNATTSPELRQQAYGAVLILFAAALLVMYLYPQFAIYPIVV